MKSAFVPLYRAVLVGAVLTCYTSLRAQATRPAPEKDPAAPSKELTPASDFSKSADDVIVLNPFEVSTVRDTGYQATETLAGTRIRTDLKDVGSAIGVVTKDFMNDIGATDSATLLQYTTNAEVAGSRGTYAGLGNGQTLFDSTPINANQRVRGIGAADNTRDYFLTDIPWDGYNTDRIDIQRGPNSILFGLGSPAGIINASSRDASFKSGGNVEERVGSYGTFRSSLDLNQVIVPDSLAIRVDGLWNNQKYEQQQAFKNDKRLYGALRFDPKLFSPAFATNIKIKAEAGKISANMPHDTPPYDSITPWFTSTANGGAGGYIVKNLYALGSNAAATNPWLATISGQQTPTYFIDGTTGRVMSINAGYINNGFLKNDGTNAGSSTNAPGQNYSEIIYGLTGYAQYAQNAQLPYYNFGQYRNRSLTDTSIFDFYKNMIDGDNRGQWANWHAYNVSVSQTGWNDRVGLEITFDSQQYTNGSWSLLGNAPSLNIDVTQVMQDGSTNPNFGRPFVSSTAGGTGTQTTNTRESGRATLFGEIRATDFLNDGFLSKLIGKHRFNLLGSREQLDTDTRNWNMYANNNAWDSFVNQTTGFSNTFTNRPPVSLVYLGPSLKNATTASGANISGTESRIKLSSGPVYLFNSTYNNAAVLPTSSYTVPAGNAYLNTVLNPTGVTTQASNLSNYVGWNNQMTLNTLSFDAGDPLYTAASKSQRLVTSYAGTWQGYMWNDAFVPTLGWRYDVVRTRSVNALPDTSNKGYLKLDDVDYALPDFTPQTTFKGHSVSGGAVLHFEKLLPKLWESVPFNFGLTYNNSQNFQALSSRVDVFGKPISNPSGKTKDFGIQLSTKDNRFTLRVIKYSTETSNATISTDSGFTNTIVQGLKFRNVFLYKLNSYTWDTRRAYGDLGPTTNNRNYWTQAYVDANGRPVQTINYLLSAQYGTTVPSTAVKLETPAEADAHRDASIRAWNDIQNYLTANNFFKIWGFTPTTASALTDRSTYEASLDPATNLPTNPQYLPDTSTVNAYSAITPAGYAITADSKSKGYEFEGSANITNNWRLQFSASQTNAINTNIGGGALQSLVNFMDTEMAGVAGDMRQFNGDYVAGNEVRRNWQNWRSGYTLLQLQEHTDASELRKWRFSVVTNYSFRNGILKGAGFGGAYRWQDKVAIGYPIHTDSNGIAAYDLSKPYYGPSESGADFWVSYEHKLTQKIGWKIQLNISNAFQNNGLIPINVQPDGVTPASYKIKPVQEWTVTNTFTF